MAERSNCVFRTACRGTRRVCSSYTRREHSIRTDPERNRLADHCKPSFEREFERLDLYRRPSRDSRRREALFDLRPVDHVPPGSDVIRPTILVLEIVGMLPHVAAENRGLAAHERGVLVGRALDGDGAAISGQPGPPAAETAGAGLGELFLELREAAERRADRIGQGPDGSLAPPGAMISQNIV